MKITLKNITSEQDSPWTVYIEQETGDKIKIKASVTPWEWLTYTKSLALSKNIKAILNAFVTQGINQHKYKGGYTEAISILKVKIKNK
jgi:hypothetical protein